ncbi:glycosyltransferase [Paenibacillus aquistagni]|uniref:glycosyltransferase n=1 Tax=Paenibacillus aquistagni TaxID=1852522 RepID=UPI00145A1480|nr:glycosyltransferase [Paenibacillus aquistagni]NMM53568.1 glycosyltransferase [Paenibacillus aquistagni]
MRQRVVVQFISGLYMGGAEMMLYHTAKHLDAEKYRTVVISLLPGGKVADMLHHDQVEVYSLTVKHKWQLPFRFIKLLMYLRKLQPDIIHSYMFHADIIGRFIGKLLNIPVVISSIRNEHIGGRHREWLLRLTDRLTDCVTVVCKKAGQVQADRGTIREEKMKVIYNGIDLSRFTPISMSRREDIRSQWGVGRTDLVFICVGRLDPQKNHRMLLSAFHKLAMLHEQAKLVLVGDGQLRGELEREVRELELEKQVEFMGVCTNVQELLQAADVFVLASKWEGLPNVVLEAMAAGTPAIATSVGGTPEVVIDQETGLLVESEDEYGLLQAMKVMIEIGDAGRQMFREHAKERVHEHFTIAQTIANTESLYEELLLKKQKGTKQLKQHAAVLQDERG